MDVELIAYILIGIFAGSIFAIGVTPIFCLLRKIFFVPFIRKSLREEAIRKGHVIEATLQKSHNVMKHTEFGSVSTMKDIGVYSYQWNGKSYKYHAITTNGLSKTIKLYFIKKPRRATQANDLGNRETPWFKCYLLVSLIMTIVTVIIGIMTGWEFIV